MPKTFWDKLQPRHKNGGAVLVIIKIRCLFFAARDNFICIKDFNVKSFQHNNAATITKMHYAIVHYFHRMLMLGSPKGRVPNAESRGRLNGNRHSFQKKGWFRRMKAK